jgi:hypothetical protein
MFDTLAFWMPRTRIASAMYSCIGTNHETEHKGSAIYQLQS